MGSYAQLPSPQPSCSPLTHRLRKLYTSGSILISFPITELEINKTNSVQSESHSSENSSNRLTKSKEPLVICPPSEEDGNCSFSELNSKPLLLACNSTTSSSASITSRRPVTLTHTPSPNQPGPVLHRENSRQNHRSLFQRSPPAPLNQSYDVESPAPNMLRPHASPLQRSQHSPEDRNTTGCAADAVQDRGEVLNLKIQLWEEDLTHQFSPLVKAQDGGTQYLQQVVSTEQHKAVCYLTAAARGFLTRRLLQTQKIKHLRKTIQDSKELIRSFQADAQQRRASFTHQDLSLQHRVRAQLRAALHSVHEIFFVWPLRTRLALLQQSRELRNERRRREMEKAKSPRDQQGLSSATQKSLERNKQRWRT
ncbi:uncharacterized protein [Salminus brasiliensis]|uniref:uncharacterized protein n=1 Tax=Salminus brasiliensis TaxID=930266 RepID=UPI003B82EFC7